MASSGSAEQPRFHERQRLQRCLQHSLNNLLQRPAVSSGDLDALAHQLAPGRALQPLWHPHRTLFLGNWDVNVLELALRRHGLELHWHDLRDAQFSRLDLDACFGIILNIKAEGVLNRLTGGRHWVALRRLGGRWWNLDSNLPAPQLVAACCGSSGQEGAMVAGEADVAAGVPAGAMAATAASAGAGGCSGGGSGGSGAAGDEAAGGAALDAPVAPALVAAAAAPEAGAVADVLAAEAEGSAAAAAEEASQVRAADASTAAEAAAAAAAAADAAADAAAVRRFLAAQVQLRDAKVFRVSPSPLASHPLAPEEGGATCPAGATPVLERQEGTCPAGAAAAAEAAPALEDGACPAGAAPALAPGADVM